MRAVLRRAAALACVALPAVANVQVWGILLPAMQTAMHPRRLASSDGPPAPTVAPYTSPPSEVLDKRANNNNTLGYRHGVYSLPYTCGAASWGSTTFPSLSVVGCCPDNPASSVPCNSYTTCLDATGTRRATTADGLTRQCGTAFPYCYRWIYYPETRYSLWGCATSASGTGTMHRTPVISTRTVTSGGTTRTIVTQKPTETGTGDEPGDPSPSPSPPPQPQPQPQTEPATPTGAIVGGVLGGIAIVALLAFAIAYLVYRHKKAAAAAAAAATATTGAPGGGPGGPSSVGSPWLGPGSPGQHAAGFNPHGGAYGGYEPVMGVAGPPGGAGDAHSGAYKPVQGFGASNPGSLHAPHHQQPPYLAGQTHEMPTEHNRPQSNAPLQEAP